MSNIIRNKFTVEQLYTDLPKDGIYIKSDAPNLKPGDISSAVGCNYLSAQNFEKAFAWFQLSINEKNSNGYVNMGWLYRTGQGVRLDFRSAMDWFLKAAEQNNPFAFSNIGEMFENGYGVPVDKYKALEWYRIDVTNEDDAQRIESEGYHISPQDRNKPIWQLMTETKALLESETSKIAISEADKVESLEVQIQEMSILSSHKQNEIDTILQLNKRFEQETHRLKGQIQELTLSNKTLYQQLQSHKTDINLLRQENQLLKVAQDPTEMKQKIQQLLDKEKQRYSELEEENKRLKREVEDKNYNTPGENDDNNDLNYDSPSDNEDNNNLK